MYQKLNPTQLILMRTGPVGAFADEPVVHELFLILRWRHHQPHHQLD